MEGHNFIRTALFVWCAAFLIFLYSPLLVMGVLSFQTGPDGGPQFPIVEWSLYWYRHLFGLTPPSRVAPLPIGGALLRSLTLACLTMVVSTILGVLTANAFRRRFAGDRAAFGLILLGMLTPGVLVGLGIALLANGLGIPRTWWGTGLAAHVVYTLPFSFLVMTVVFRRFDPALEDAAASLGVSPARTFRCVTFPLISPGIVSSMLFAFTLSYDEFARTLFSAGADATLPLAIYGTFTTEIHPNLFAFGVITTLFSFSLLAVYGALMAITVMRTKRHAIQEEIA